MVDCENQDVFLHTETHANDIMYKEGALGNLEKKAGLKISNNATLKFTKFKLNFCSDTFLDSWFCFCFPALIQV